MAVLTTKARKAMPTKSFALPAKREGGKGGYPIPDKAHARNALSRVSQFGSSAEKTTVRAKVRAKYPTIGKMHNGGTVKADGPYDLKAGEHVLTEKEAATARNHALMASGMKSLTNPGPKAGKGTPKTSITIEAAPKTTFTDKDLSPRMSPAGANRVSTDNAKPGGTISPEANAPRQARTAKASDTQKT